MGRGVGRALFAHAIKRARASGFRAVEIESDPNAAGFYDRMGAQRVGTKVSEVQGERRELPLFVYEVGNGL
jgi:predicted N-acetyltransferase YhbS